MSRYTPEERRQRLRDIEARNHRNGLHAGMHVQTCPACNEERSPWDEPPCPVCGGYMDRPHPHPPEAPTGRFGRCAKCGTDIDVDGGCRCPSAPPKHCPCPGHRVAVVGAAGCPCESHIHEDPDPISGNLLPDPAPEAPTGRFGRCAKCGTDIDVDGGCRCPTAPDSLRLDPEDPESVPAACLALANRLGREFVSGGAPEALSVASILRHFAREWKASALPDPAPEAQA